METETGFVPPTAETKQIPEPTNITYVKEGPKFVDILKRNDPRDNLIVAHLTPMGKFNPRTFSERQGLENLNSLIDQTIQTAQGVRRTKIAQEAQAFRDNLVYIGDPELRDATQGIAQHIVEIARSGKNVILHHYGNRSERYIALRVLEEFDYQTEQSPELRERVKVSGSAHQVASGMVRDPNSVALIVDDFVVSGSRMRGWAGNLIDLLAENGVDRKDAVRRLEASVVAAPIRFGRDLLRVTEDNLPLKTFSYFKVPEYRNDKGEWYVFPGISVTGTHSPTDYGFEVEVHRLQEFLGSNRKMFDAPLPIYIVKPYEIKDTGPRDYKDPALQQRWEKISEKYNLQIQSASGN